MFEFTNTLPIATFYDDILYPPEMKHSLNLDRNSKEGLGAGGKPPLSDCLLCNGDSQWVWTPGCFHLLQFILLSQNFPSPSKPISSLSWSLAPNPVISINWARYHHALNGDNHSLWVFRREQRMED